MQQFQLSLFYNLQMLLLTSNFYRKYYELFKALDLSSFPGFNTGVGCTGFSRKAFVRALVVKHLEQLKSIPALLTFLDSHPALCEMCGFPMGILPDASQFYKFLSKTNNSLLENIHLNINKELVDQGIASLDTFIMDSKPVMAASRDNNFKNPKRNTKNKFKTPKRNPSASLSYYSYQEVNGKKDNFIFFWGYRTHVIISKEGIPLVEVTLPNKYTDIKVAKKLIRKLKRVFRFKKDSILIADAAYDEKEFYNFIVGKLKCQAFIPINPRNKQEDKTFGPHGLPLCDAKLEMTSAGAWTEGLRDRLKFRCPLKANKKIIEKYPNGCPCNNPRFSNGKSYGCTKYLDVTDDARSRVPRDSKLYKDTYNQRTAVERYFARLGDREAEQTTHYKIKSVKNQMTIAHLSMSLVAYAAVLMGRNDKIRCYRTFANRCTSAHPA